MFDALAIPVTDMQKISEMMLFRVQRGWILEKTQLGYKCIALKTTIVPLMIFKFSLLGTVEHWLEHQRNPGGERGTENGTAMWNRIGNISLFSEKGAADTFAKSKNEILAEERKE